MFVYVRAWCVLVGGGEEQGGIARKIQLPFPAVVENFKSVKHGLPATRNENNENHRAQRILCVELQRQ